MRRQAILAAGIVRGLGLALVLLAAAAGALLGAEPDAVALRRLDAVLEEHPEDLAARAERARLRDQAGLPMQAFLDRRVILEHHPDDSLTARLAAYDLMAAGAPGAARELVARYPAALAGEAGVALDRELKGDLAARRIRWGWAEPVFVPAQSKHEALAAIATLEAMHQADPSNARAAGDLLLAYRLAGQMQDVVMLWEKELRRDDAPYWLKNAAADAYLSLHQPATAEALYRSFAEERKDQPQPWLGIYWSSIDQRHFDQAAAALDRLAKVPGQELAAEIQRGWLLLFADRTRAGRAQFERLFSLHPGDPGVREGLATAYLWEGWPRRGLRAVDELLARTTLSAPFVDRPSARIARAGALMSLGDLAAARRLARRLVALYPDNEHAQRMLRDVDTALSPEVRLEARYDTSDRGLGETWAQLEASVPLGPRLRLAAGTYRSRSEDDRYRLGDDREAYLGLSARPARWLSGSAEVSFDVADNGLDRQPAGRLQMAVLPDDRWRLDLGYSHDAWRDLSVRARAAGIVADTYDAGVTYRQGLTWNVRAGGGRSELTDGNVRRYALLGGQRLVRPGPVYRAYLGAELYASDNSRSDVPYYSPQRDSSVSLTHRSEWVSANRPGRRHTWSLQLHVGSYAEQGFASGVVGGAWLESDWDLGGRTALVVGGGARSQLYDGSRELDPRVYVTLRRRL